MAEDAGSSLEKIRDETIRALNRALGLTPQQISSLRLSDVHLATRSLALATDAYAPGDAPEKPQELVLDEQTQRALIAWLVVRPDGPNDHLFPGSEWEGLDTSIIEQILGVVVEEKAVASDQAAPAAPAGVVPFPGEAEAPEALPKGATSLEEIEALRQELAAVDEGWSPLAKPQPSHVATPPPEGSAAPTTLPETVVRRAEPAAPTPSAPPRPAPVQPAPPSPPPPPPRPVRPAVVARSRVSRPAAPKPTPTVKPSAPRTPAPRAVPPRVSQPIEASTVEEGRRPISPLLAAAAVLLVIACCAASIWGIVWLVGGGGAGPGWLAQALPAGLVSAIATPTPTPTETPPPTPTATSTATPVPTETPTPTPMPTETPTPIIEPPPTPTPIIIVVTATPTPEPPPTPRRVPTDTPVPAEPPQPTYKYPAPKLLEPENGGKVGGRLAYLKWEPVGPLAEDEWYAVRLIYLQQGQPVYQGDNIKETTWQVPERFYYQADGPALLYRWYVYVERKNPDGTATQLSPNSEEFVFRWE
ncbi:MAG: hypothetical protein NZ765_03055 [Anaerolineae bacterium]|nr:hypothetical protein [Anaerolineae bacterium]MDW8070283.1 hypothetical protein [Anaerolineae bacterium]